MTVAGELANYAIGLSFRDLPPDVVHQAKRTLLDTVGCAFGGFPSEASKVLHSVIRQQKSLREATTIGSGLKAACMNAALINGAMVRYLDFNDMCGLAVGQWLIGGHPSEVIPGALAVGERQHSSGQEVIAATVLGYELSARFMEGTQHYPMSKKGWNFDTRGAYIMPLVAGKLLGLNQIQMENAVGISGCHSMTLGVLDTPGEEYTMSKNLRFPYTAYDAIMAALLAKEGFTGPVRVIEGHDGFVQTIMGGDFDLDKLLDFGGKFRILDTEFKPFAAVGSTHGHLTATLQLVKEHNIKPEDIAEVKIWVGTHAFEHTADEVKRNPRNQETADHSTYYTTAVVIMDHMVGPAQYEPERLENPKVRELMDKVTVVLDKELDRFGRGGVTQIRTKSGATYKYRVEYPRGHYLNPATDAELEDKFRMLVSSFISEQRIRQVINAIYDLDKLEDIGELMSLLVCNRRQAKSLGY